jgi:hypothetical protein
MFLPRRCRPVNGPPLPATNAHLDAVLTRAAKAVSPHTRQGDGILKHLLPGHVAERCGDRWWLIGTVRVLGEAERWEVWFDPEADEGRLHKVPAR